jgi:hypothetical protein
MNVDGSPENAMFAHHCLLAEKRVTTPSHLSRNNFYISSIRWHAFISYMWVCYCTAKPLNPGWTYETRCIYQPTRLRNFFILLRTIVVIIIINSKHLRSDINCVHNCCLDNCFKLSAAETTSVKLINSIWLRLQVT